MTTTAPPAHGLLIDGEWRTTDAVLESRNPARPQEVVARVARAGPADVRAAYDAAAAAA
ncbi:MAG: hypothetical protein JWQ48_4006, partial [Conexibacter sp.]|nr:hypothetical protein [Conexibacter sp.]